jgi:hypothetical protein
MMELLALVAQAHALPGVEGAGINRPEMIVAACALGHPEWFQLWFIGANDWQLAQAIV